MMNLSHPIISILKMKNGEKNIISSTYYNLSTRGVYYEKN